VIENLAVKLLVGSDILRSEEIMIDYRRKTTIIESYGKLIINILVTQRSSSKIHRPLFAKKRIIIFLMSTTVVSI
jgi:hypothetical protein